MTGFLRLALATAGLLVMLLAGTVAYARQSEPQSPGLAFLGSVDGERGLYVHFITRDGRGVRQLADVRADFGPPIWSRDGRWVFFASGAVDRGTAIYRTSVSSQRATPLTDAGGFCLAADHLTGWGVPRVSVDDTGG